MANITDMMVTTLDEYSPQFFDNVLKGNFLLSRLMSKDHIKLVDGGLKMMEPLMYGQNDTFKWFSGADILNTTMNNALTAAFYKRKNCNVNIIITGDEERDNKGSKTQRFNIVESKIKVAEITMKNKVGAALYSTAKNVTDAEDKMVGGLPILIADDPRTGVVGEIDAKNNEWWRNQYNKLATSTTVTPESLLTEMDTMLMSCTRGKDMPTVIIMDKKYFSLYKQACIKQKRIVSTEKADGGFKTLEFEGIPVYWDVNCPDNHAYFINEDYLFFKVHEDAKFKLGSKRLPYNQDATVFPMIFSGNLTCSNRSLQGVIYTPVA